MRAGNQHAAVCSARKQRLALLRSLLGLHVVLDGNVGPGELQRGHVGDVPGKDHGLSCRSQFVEGVSRRMPGVAVCPNAGDDLFENASMILAPAPGTEIETIRTLSEAGQVVIACGGGTVIDPENVASLKANGRIFLLDIPIEAVAERLQNDTTRPLLNRPDKDIAMRELYEKRLPLYRAAADIIINADNSPMQICRDILSAL